MYVPKSLIHTRNVNVSHDAPLREFAALAGSILLILGCLFFALSYFIDSVVDYLPVSIDERISVTLPERYSKKAPRVASAERASQTLLNALVARSSLGTRHFTLILADEPTVNAIAAPGNTIVIYTGLLKDMQSENELAMVLAHELGHFANRDHLRSMGRRTLLSLLYAVLFSDTADADAFSLSLDAAIANHSRQQEAAADEFGLTLIQNYYGHTGHALEFYKRMQKQERKVLPTLFRTHPFSADRIQRMTELMKQRGYETRSAAPLPAEILAITRTEGAL